MTLPIVIDCDPANDDALAILVAAGLPGVEILAVTAVAGHLVVEETTHNAAIAAAAAGLVDIPVAAGCARPVLRDQILAGILDLERGLDRRREDLPRVELDPRHAVDVLYEAFLARPGATLVMTGPLTNLAVALSRHPDLGTLVGRVVTLGGAWGMGNKSAAAEFNILCDPEAAAAVYASGLPITMVPVDVTAHVPVSDELVGRVSALGTPVGAFAAELLASLQTTHWPGPGPLAIPDAGLHDPVAVVLAAQPGLARSVRARVDVETAGRHTYGRTVVDFAGKSGAEPNADVVIEVDVQAVHDALVAAIGILASTGEGALR
jgi:inosine-uridine nucleoside N-ribohydrolase